MEIAQKIYIMTVSASGKSTFTNKHPYYKNVRIVDFSAIASIKTRQQAKLEIERKNKPARKNPFIFLRNLIRISKRKLSKYLKTNNSKEPVRLPYTGKSYHQEIISYIRATSGPVVVLGRMGLPEPGQYQDITIAAVLIPEAEHRRNCNERKRQHPNGSWTSFDEVKDMRAELQSYAQQHAIPLYPSFASALEKLLGHEE